VRRVQITHPFHPWHGQRFIFLTSRHNWGEDRVYFHDAAGQLRSVPAAWTDAVPADPFVAVAAGRALFRPDDLLAAVALIREMDR
jgi:Family of unknown function (DUF5372)